MKVYVYVQSEESSDLKLDDLNLKLIEPALKNGKSITFDISQDDCYIYIVFDKNFPKKFHTKYLLEAGNENVALFTKPKLDPFRGNPFIIFK